MNVAFRESFTRDLRSIRDKAVLVRVRQVIETVERSQTLADIPNLKKLKAGLNY